MKRPRPNVYKRNVPTWRQEVGAWLLVVGAVIGLRITYYLIIGV